MRKAKRIGRYAEDNTLGRAWRNRPKYFIPIHGEYRHLILHARLAEQVGIPKENILVAENGQVIEFAQNGGRVGESVLTGRVFIDGKGIGDVGRL